MILKRGSKIHIVWAILCGIAVDGCFEYTSTIYPMFPGTGQIEGAEILHPAWIPMWLLPYIILVWILGHIAIYVYYKGRE
jgi:hypothetical protein